MTIPTFSEMTALYTRLRELPPPFQNLVVNVLRHWNEKRQREARLDRLAVAVKDKLQIN
jgi:hypothetical protein